MRPINVGDRGKAAEAKVREVLDRYAGWSSFAFHRMPDARAGSRQPTLADFIIMQQARPSLLEVKEVSKGLCRLPHKNFDKEKVARMRAWHMAGCSGYVLVHFVENNTWRLAIIDFFLTREGGSWDMSNYAAGTLEAQLEIVYGPLPVKRVA